MKVTACIPGYELKEQLPPSICQICAPNYYCSGGVNAGLPCPANGFSDFGANASSDCRQFAINIQVFLPISKANFTSSVITQASFLMAIESAIGVTTKQVSLVSVIESIAGSRRTYSSSLQVNAQISADTAVEASTLRSKVSTAAINNNLKTAGLPQSTSVSTEVNTSVSGTFSGSSGSLPTPVIAGASVSRFVFMMLVSIAVYLLVVMLMRQRVTKAFVGSFSNARTGDTASDHMLPPDLKKQYTADLVLGKGAFGCVVKAKKHGSDQEVAIKIVLPEKGVFDEKETRILRREAKMHELFMSKKCEHAVHLAASTGAVEIRADVCWLVLEFLDGKDMDSVVHCSENLNQEHVQGTAPDTIEQPIDDTECIKASRSVLAALKVMHSEGIVHRDIKPANNFLCTQHHGKSVSAYKLIDFGSALGPSGALGWMKLWLKQPC